MNDDRKNDLYNTGKLTMFYGNPLMELPQAIKQGGFKAEAPELLMADDEIFIIPDNVGKPVKMIVEPELIDINESGVRVDDTFEFAVRFTQGVTVLTSAFIGLIKITA